MRFLAAIMLVLWAPIATAYEETLKIPGSPELRVALGPRTAAETFGYVHSEFVLRIQLVSAFEFEALKFHPPTVENAKVVRILTPRTKAVSTYAGSGFIFEAAYAIFPDRAGELVIPALVAEGVIEPKPGELAPFRSETLEQRIEIRDIPPEFQGDWWFVTPRIQFEETWSKQPEEAQVGDILRREVTLTAYGVAAERLPDLELRGSNGVVVSDHGGDRNTLLSTDGLIGKVTRSWDIRVADPRVGIIGPVAIEHWHPSYHRSIRVEAPARRSEPAPLDRKADAEALLSEMAEDRQVGLAMGLALLVLILSPFAALLVALIWAALPTAADRKMKVTLAGAETPAAAWRAVEEWANASAYMLKNETNGYRNLSKALFAEEAESPDQQAICRELIAYSKRQRIDKCVVKTMRWVDLLLGKCARLDS